MQGEQRDDPRKWTIHRNQRGWPRWYQRWLEVWWIVIGKWSLHRAWQDGKDYGAQMEYQRIIDQTIIAASDILDALIEIVEYRGGADHAVEDEYVMERARSAIAKATGMAEANNAAALRASDGRTTVEDASPSFNPAIT